MAKKTKTPKTDVGSIFDHFARHGGGPGPADKPAGQQQQDQQPNVDALIARIDAMGKEMNDLRAENRRATAVSGPTKEDEQINVPALDIVTGMPDQMEKPTEYSAELQRRMTAHNALQGEASRRQAQIADRQRQRSDALWNGFAEKHPEWAGHQELVENTATRLVKEAQAKGLDPNKYLFATTETFYGDLNKQLTTKYGKLLEAGDDGDEEGEEGQEEPANRGGNKARRSTDYPQHGDDLGRTDGTFSGQEGGGKPAYQKPGKDQPGDMIADIQALQQRDGYF